MSENIRFGVDMTDGVSGPSRAAQSSLTGLGKALKGVSGAVSTATGSTLGKALGTVASFGAGLTGAGLSLIGLGAKYALDASSFKDESIKALTNIEGTADLAATTYDKIAKLADKTPFEMRDVVQKFSALRGAGLTQGQASTVFATFSDIAAQQGANRKASMDALQGAFMKMNSEGKVTSETLQQFGQSASNSGGTAAILAQLAKDRGQTIDQVKKDIEQGKVSAQQFQNSLTRFTEDKIDKGKGLGFVAEQVGLGTVAGQLASMKNGVDALFSGVDTTVFVRALANINTMFTSPAAKEFGELVTQITNELGDMFADATGGDRMVTLFTGLTATFGTLWSVTKQFFGDFGRGLWTIMGPVAELWGQLSGGDEAISFLRTGLASLGKILGWTVGALVLGTGLIVGAVVFLTAATAMALDGVVSYFNWWLEFWAGIGGKVVGFIGPIVSMVGSALGSVLSFLWTPLYNGGGFLVQGLSDGISFAFRGLIAMWHGLINLLPEGVKEILGIHSPSTVFFGYGGNIVEGLYNGVDARLDPQEFSAKFAAPKLDMSLPVFNSRGGSEGITVTVTVNAQGSTASAQEIGRATGSEVERALQNILARQSLALGAR